MSKHPIDFLREEFLEPAGVTQNLLCDKLDIGHKTLSELYQHKRGMTVATAKKFAAFVNVAPEQLLLMQAQYDLDHDNSEYKISSLQTPRSVQRLLDRLHEKTGKQYTLKDLHLLFNKAPKEVSPDFIKALLSAPLTLIVAYMADTKIGLSHLKKLYNYYLKQLKGKPSHRLEMMLIDSDQEAVKKMCNNGQYFSNSRDFEMYVFYRLRLMHRKKMFLDLANDISQSSATRKRALYFYNFITKEQIELTTIDTEPVSVYENSKPLLYKNTENKGLYSKLEQRRFDQFIETGSW